MNKLVKIILIVLILLSTNIFANDEKSLVGKDAESFFLRSLQGKSVYFSKILKEKNVVLMSFFATWCIPCRSEIPEIEKMTNELSQYNFKVYYLHVGKDKAKGNFREQVNKMKSDLSMTQPILLDFYTKVAEKYDALSLPTTVLIGKDGKIKYTHSGYKKGDEIILKNKIKEALGIVEKTNLQTDSNSNKIDTTSDFQKNILNIIK